MDLLCKPYHARLALFTIASVAAASCCFAIEGPRAREHQDVAISIRQWLKADLYVTAKGTADRITKKESPVFEPLEQPDEHTPTIILDRFKTFQTIVGFGGALTDASAETFYKLPKEKQQEILTGLFDRQKGNGFSLCRTNIHSCDFSSDGYVYAEVPGDSSLAHFTIAHDLKYRIPFIKAAMKVADSVKEWRWGEVFGRSMIMDLNNWASGWVAWNVILDEQGGPNHLGNYCMAPIICNTKSAELTYMNSFYYLGHFSRFIRPGAKRIICSSNADALLATAFLNEDGAIAMVVMNPSDREVTFYTWIENRGVKTTSPAHSIVTLVM